MVAAAAGKSPPAAWAAASASITLASGLAEASARARKGQRPREIRKAGVGVGRQNKCELDKKRYVVRIVDESCLPGLDGLA